MIKAAHTILETILKRAVDRSSACELVAASRDQMKVLIYCLSSVSGGAVTYLRNIAPLLVEHFAESRKHRLIFLAHEEQAPLLSGIDPALVYWVPGVRPTGYRRIWWEKRNLPRIVREQGVDVLFNPYQIRIRVLGVRQVMMVQNMEPFLFKLYQYSFNTWLRNHLLYRESLSSLRRAERVIAISCFVRDHLIQHVKIKRDRIRKIYHGSPDLRSDTDKVKDQEMLAKISVENDYFFSCGSLLPYRRRLAPALPTLRRCDCSIQSLRAVLGPRYAVGYCWFGGGSPLWRDRYGETIHRAIASSPMRERILTLGHVPWDTMAALYRRCAAFVIATEIEACPNIAIEAMAAGCVIVSSNRSPLPEMFQGCSLEYRARDISHLAHQMMVAVNDGVLRSELRDLALRRGKTFSWVKCADETYSALIDW